MFDFQTQTISTNLILAGQAQVSPELLADMLCLGLEGQSGAAGQTAADPLNGVTLRSDDTLLHASWQTEDSALVLSLNLADTGRTSTEASDSLQTRMIQVLRPLLAQLPVDAVEWMDTGLRIPASEFAAAIAPAALDTALPMPRIAPRRVAKPASGGAIARLSPQDARARIQAATKPALPVPPLTVAPRRVAKPAAETQRLSHEAAATIANLLPRIDPAERIAGANANAPLGAEPQDAHVRAYEAHRLAMIRQDPDQHEIEALRDAEGLPTTEARLSTWALSLTVATVSLPMALPVMAYNVARGEDFRAASLVLGLAAFFSMIQGSGAMAAVLGAF